MSDSAPQLGIAAWIDLTVENAPELRDFYAAAIGWTAQEIPMEGYADYAMVPAGAETAAAGICHHRGANQGIPPSWIVYFTVPDLEASLKEVTARGGATLHGPRNHGQSRFAIIRDPAGASCGLFQPA